MPSSTKYHRAISVIGFAGRSSCSVRRPLSALPCVPSFLWRAAYEEGPSPTLLVVCSIPSFVSPAWRFLAAAYGWVIRQANPTSPLGVGGLANFVFSLPKPPPSPARGRGLPLPLPPPLGLGWGGQSGQSVQDGPRWLQEGLREPKMASKMPKVGQDGSR